MENICHWPRLPSERPSAPSHRFRFCRFLPSAAFVSASPPATMAAGTRVLVWNESLLSAHHPANGTSGPLGCAGLILLPVASRRSRSGSQRIHFVGDHRAPVCSCDLFDRPELGSDSGSAPIREYRTRNGFCGTDGGFRYHALTHLFPSLPYHAMGKAHRHLMNALPEDSPYRKTCCPGFFTALRELFRGAHLAGKCGQTPIQLCHSAKAET